MLDGCKKTELNASKRTRFTLLGRSGPEANFRSLGGPLSAEFVRGWVLGLFAANARGWNHSTSLAPPFCPVAPARQREGDFWIPEFLESIAGADLRPEPETRYRTIPPGGARVLCFPALRHQADGGICKSRSPHAALTNPTRGQMHTESRRKRRHRSQGAVSNPSEPLHHQALRSELNAAWTNAWTTSAYYRPT